MMWAILVPMLIILAAAAVVLLIVTMGVEGHGKSRHPQLADRLARTAKHLNGDGQPPQRLEKLLHR